MASSRNGLPPQSPASWRRALSWLDAGPSASAGEPLPALPSNWKDSTLVLIHRYLREEGLVSSALALEQECGLTALEPQSQELQFVQARLLEGAYDQLYAFVDFLEAEYRFVGQPIVNVLKAQQFYELVAQTPRVDALLDALEDLEKTADQATFADACKAMSVKRLQDLVPDWTVRGSRINAYQRINALMAADFESLHSTPIQKHSLRDQLQQALAWRSQRERAVTGRTDQSANASPPRRSFRTAEARPTSPPAIPKAGPGWQISTRENTRTPPRSPEKPSSRVSTPPPRPTPRSAARVQSTGYEVVAKSTSRGKANGSPAKPAWGRPLSNGVGRGHKKHTAHHHAHHGHGHGHHDHDFPCMPGYVVDADGASIPLIVSPEKAKREGISPSRGEARPGKEGKGGKGGKGRKRLEFASASGGRLVYGGGADLTMGLESAEVFRDTQPIRCIAFCEQYAALGCNREKAVRVMRTDGSHGSRWKEAKAFLQHHRGSIYAIDFRRAPSSGLMLATASNDHAVKIVHATNDLRGESTVTLSGHNGTVRDVSISTSGGMVLSGGAGDQCLRVWDVDACALLSKLDLHQATIVRTIFSRRHEHAFMSADALGIVAGDVRSRAPAWRATAARLRETDAGRQGAIRALALSSESTVLAAVGYSDGVCQLVDVRKPEVALQTTLMQHRAEIRSIDFSPNALLLTSSFDGTAHAYSAEGSHLASVSAQADKIVQAQWDPNSLGFATCETGRRDGCSSVRFHAPRTPSFSYDGFEL